MGASSWIPTVAVAAALVGVGAYTMTRDCDSCLISSILGNGDAQVTTVAADAHAEKSGCCSLGASKADAVMAAAETDDVILVAADAQAEKSCCALGSKADAVMAASETDGVILVAADVDVACEQADCCEGAEDCCESEEIAANETTDENAGDG